MVGAGFAVFIILFLVIGVGSAALWVWGLVDAATRPEWVFQRGGSSKVMWIVLIAVLGAIAAIIYLLSVRPRLVAVQQSLQQQQWGWGATATWSAGPSTNDPTASFPAAGAVAPAGWYDDPSRRHRMRYWDGTSWTPSVWDGGPVISDPLSL